MSIETFAIPTHLDTRFTTVGWGNGYVGVPKGHPWYGKDYNSIDCQIHGGLTYAEDHAPTKKPDGLWWVGFDTAHVGDNPVNRSQSFVESEIQNLKNQALEAAKEANASPNTK